MVTRRIFLAASAGVAAVSASPHLARAQGGEAAEATQFIEEFGNKLVAIVNGGGSADEKRQQMQPLIDNAVAVDEIATFVLGRFVRIATPEQRQKFVQLFHQVLIVNVTSKLGQFRGVTYSMTQTAVRNGEAFVGTLITRPNQKPNNVQWVVTMTSGRPQIVDVVAEGTSLRLTQRADYASFLSRNNNNVDALITALERQVS